MKNKNTFDNFIKRKIYDINLLNKISRDLKERKKKIILCHGTFDLLHAGHFRHFQDSKNLGDVLIVTLTADKYINKGPGRPIFNQYLRAEMIASLSYVDYVSIINDPSALPAIKNLKPDVYVKGNDYKDKNKDLTKKISIEEKEVKKNGGYLKFTDNISFSSSSLINENFFLYDESLNKIIKKYKKVGINYFLSLIKKLKNLSVMLIGDSIIDEYIYTNTLGKSAKENILATLKKDEQVFAGGAIAAANHISDFCKEVTLVTGIGDRSNNYREYIRKSLRKNVKLIDLKLNQRPTTKKNQIY